jgi:autotransporter passenger strand-loop-strand repeat protein
MYRAGACWSFLPAGLRFRPPWSALGLVRAPGGLILSGAKGGGTASGTLVTEGGQEAVFSGGTEVGATVNSGGGLLVFCGGTARGAAVGDAGTLTVGLSAGGRAINTDVQSNGDLQVFFRGVASATSIDSGGVENVFSGGTDIWCEGGRTAYNADAHSSRWKSCSVKV